MARAFAEKFYRSKEWKNTKNAYIRSVHGLCERCLAYNIYVPGRIVHHKVHLTPENIGDPSVSLNPCNLEYLCMDCHNKEHFGSETIREVRFDDDGNVIPREGYGID